MSEIQTFFWANLFDLFETADKVVINGYEIESIQDIGEDESGAPLMRCEVSDDIEWNFKDQRVKVRHHDGGCVAITAGGEEEGGDDQVEIEFMMERALEEDDVLFARYRELNIAVIPASDKFDPEDEGVAGIYSVWVHKCLSPEDQASAALDAFHESVQVSVLDDFSFWVFDPETRLVMLEGDAESYTMGSHAKSVLMIYHEVRDGIFSVRAHKALQDGSEAVIGTVLVFAHNEDIATSCALKHFLRGKSAETGSSPVCEITRMS